MGFDPAVVDEWVWSRLRAGNVAGGRIYPDLAPASATRPFVIVGQMSGRDRLTVEGVRVLFEGVWSIKVVGSGADYGPLVPVAAAIDAALNLATGSVAGGEVYECVREEAFRLPPAPEAGALSYQIVQVFRVRARAA